MEKQTGWDRKQAIKDLSRTNGWLEAEITRQKGADPKKCTKKRCIVLRKLSKLTGGRAGRFDLNASSAYERNRGPYSASE